MFTLLKKAVLTAAVLAGGVMASTLVATPAYAQGTAPCPSYYYCFYQHSYYNRYQSGWHLNYYSTTFGRFSSPPSSSRTGLQNQLSSIINNGNRTVCVYDDRWYDSVLLVRVAPYQDYINLADIGKNDKADYWRMYSGSASCPGD